jgi:mono/diheme cytochrome c family protein
VHGLPRTAGFGADKRADPRAYGGGFELKDAAGQPLLTANVTPDVETGLGRWSEEDVVRALRDGLHPDGSGIRLMPELRLRLLGDDELHAIARYLRTLRPVHGAVPRPGATPAGHGGPADAGPGAALFARYGCVTCHGPGRPYRDRLQKAAGQPLEEVTARILHPEQFNESSPMPVFANLMDEATARQLAEHVRALAAAPEQAVR